jgi:hypothetical protein
VHKNPSIEIVWFFRTFFFSLNIHGAEPLFAIGSVSGNEHAAMK